MLKSLKLTHVGPAPKLEIDLAPRLNLLAGDNGLGKSFLLDVAWWVLTTTWAGEKAFPWRPPAGMGEDVSPPPSEIRALLAHRNGPLTDTEIEVGGIYDRKRQDWSRVPSTLHSQSTGQRWSQTHDGAHRSRPSPLVLNARMDGSFAIWDSYYVRGGIQSFAESAIHLTASEVWDGKEAPDAELGGGKRTVIAGLIADWVNWQQRARSEEFDALKEVLRTLSSPAEPLLPGEPTRVHLRDRRDIPTLALPYGVVPVTLASAGIKRALSLAYLLVWAWSEHLKAAHQTQRAPTRDILLLIDEPELHQHPTWQRVYVPALLRAVEALSDQAAVQILATTHSPLVMASVEPSFDPAQDRIFRLELEQGIVKLHPLVWAKQGDVLNWLIAMFGLKQGHSVPAEHAIEAAEAFMRGDVATLPPEMNSEEKIHEALVRLLPGHDVFWPRWIATTRYGRNTS